nr:hypothetical protein CFP56_01295 [Quercus suber]
MIIEVQQEHAAPGNFAFGPSKRVLWSRAAEHPHANRGGQDETISPDRSGRTCRSSLHRGGAYASVVFWAGHLTAVRGSDAGSDPNPGLLIGTKHDSSGKDQSPEIVPALALQDAERCGTGQDVNKTFPSGLPVTNWCGKRAGGEDRKHDRPMFMDECVAPSLVHPGLASLCLEVGWFHHGWPAWAAWGRTSSVLSSANLTLECGFWKSCVCRGNLPTDMSE